MLAFFTMNHMEWIVILVVVLLLFGHRLPGMARSLGSGITEFKRGLKDGNDKSSGDKSSADRSGDKSTGAQPKDGANDKITSGGAGQ